MNRFVVPPMPRQARRPELRAVSRFLAVLICCGLAAPAQQITQRGDTGASFSTRATHLLGFANARNNSAGTLPFRTILCNSSRTGSLAQK
jgi:hypothetical protein